MREIQLQKKGIHWTHSLFFIMMVLLLCYFIIRQEQEKNV